MSPPPMSGQVLGAEGQQDHGGDGGQADRADDDGVALPEGLHTEAAPLGPGLVGHREVDAGGQDDAALELAEVEVEPRAVDRGAADLLELDRQHLEGPVELGLVGVEVAGDLAQPLDVADERLADARDQVGGLDGERRDLVEGGEDRVAVLLQAAHEVAEAGDQPAELLVAVADVDQHLVEVVDEVADDLVAGGQGLGHRRGVTRAATRACRPRPGRPGRSRRRAC